jgi:hypothetical protein
VDGMADKGDVRMRVIVELALAAETSGDVEQDSAETVYYDSAQAP